MHRSTEEVQRKKPQLLPGFRPSELSEWAARKRCLSRSSTGNVGNEFGPIGKTNNQECTVFYGFVRVLLPSLSNIGLECA